MSIQTLHTTDYEKWSVKKLSGTVKEVGNYSSDGDLGSLIIDSTVLGPMAVEDTQLRTLKPGKSVDIYWVEKKDVRVVQRAILYSDDGSVELDVWSETDLFGAIVNKTKSEATQLLAMSIPAVVIVLGFLGIAMALYQYMVSIPKLKKLGLEIKNVMEQDFQKSILAKAA